MYTFSTMEQKSQKRIRNRQNKQKISKINASYNQFEKGLMGCHHSVDISNERCNSLERNDKTVSTKKKAHFVNIKINIKAPLPSSSTKEELVNSFVSKLHSISPRNSFVTSQSNSEFAMPTPIKVESFDELVGDYVSKDSYSQRIRNEYGFNIEQQIKTEDDDFLSIISDIGSSTVQCNDRILNCADKNIKKLTFNKIEQPTNLYLRNKVVEKENAINNIEISESGIEEGNINTLELLREESTEHEINTKENLESTKDITLSYNITPSARKKILELNCKSLTSSLELEEAHEKGQSSNNSISACQDLTSITIPDKLMTPTSENRKKTRKNKRYNRISDTESSECHDDNKDATETTELGFEPNVSQPQDVSIETAKSEIESLAEDLCEDPKMTSLNKNKQLSTKIVATEALVHDDSSMNLERQTNRCISITERPEMKRSMKQLEAKVANASVGFVNSNDAMTTHEIIDLDMDKYNSHNSTEEQIEIVDKKDDEAEKHIVRGEFFDTINSDRAADISGDSIKMLNDQSRQEITKLSDVAFTDVFEKGNDDRKAESDNDNSEHCNCYRDDNYSDHDHISNSCSDNENLLSSKLEYTKDKTQQNNSIKSSRKREHDILSDSSSDDPPCNDMKLNTSKGNKIINETVSTELQNTKDNASADITSDVSPNLEIAQTQSLIELKALPDISDNEGKKQEGKKAVTSKVNEENVSLPFKAKAKLRKTRTSRNTKRMKCNVSSSDSSHTDCNTEFKLGNNRKRISLQLESNEKEMRQRSSDKEIINFKNSSCISGEKVRRSQLPNLNASFSDSSSDSEISTSLNLSKPKSRPLHTSCDEKLKNLINSKKQKLLDTEDCSSSDNDSFNNVNADVNNRSDSEDSLQELIKLRKNVRQDANHVALDYKNMVEKISDSKVTKKEKKILHNSNVEISEDNAKNAQDSLNIVIEAYNNYYNIDNFIIQSPKINGNSNMKAQSEKKTLSLKKTKNDSEAALRPSSHNSTDSEVVAINALPSESSEKNNGAEKYSEVERRFEKKALFKPLSLTESNNDTKARLRSNSHSSVDLEVLPINKSPLESSKKDNSSKEPCKASLNNKFKNKTSTPKTNNVLQCVKKSSTTNERETSQKHDTSKACEETTGLNKRENENSSKKSVEENVNEIPSQEILDIVMEVFSKTDELSQSKSKKEKTKGVAHDKSEKTKKKTLNTKTDKKNVIPKDKKTNGKKQKLTDDSDPLNSTEEKQQPESPKKTEDEINTNLNNKNVIRRSPRKSVHNDSLESTKSSTVSEGLDIIKEQNKAVNKGKDNTTEPNIESEVDRNEISNQIINEVDTNITSENTPLKPSGAITPRISGKSKEKIKVKFDFMKLRSKSNSTKKKYNSIISYFREGVTKEKEIQKQDVNKQKLTNFIKDNTLSDTLQQSSLTEQNRNDTCPDQDEDVVMIGSEARPSMSNIISNNDVLENDTRKSPRIKEKQCKRGDDQHEVTTQQATTKSNRHSYENYMIESTNVTSVDKEDELNSVMQSVSTNNVGNSKNTTDKNLIDLKKGDVLNNISLQLTPPAHTSNSKSLHCDTVAIKKLSQGQNMSNANSVSMCAHTNEYDINKSLRSSIITEKQSKKHENEAEKENQSKTDEYQIEVAKQQQTPTKSNIKASDSTIESEDIIPCSQINKSFTPRKRSSSLCITSQIILRQRNENCLLKKNIQSNGNNIAGSSEPKYANNLPIDVVSENDHINDIDNENEHNIHDARDSLLPYSLESQLSNKITKGHNYNTSSINISQQTEAELTPEVDVEQCMESNCIAKNDLNDSLLVHCGTISPGMNTTFDTDKTSDCDLEAQLMSTRERDKKRKLIDKHDDHRPSKRFKGEVNKLLKVNASSTQTILNEDSSSGQSVQALASTTSSTMSNTTQILNGKKKGKERIVKLIKKTFDEMFEQRFDEKWKSKEKSPKKQKTYKRTLTTTSDDETTSDEDFEVKMKRSTRSKANISKQYSSKKRKALVMNCIEKLKSVKIHKSPRNKSKDDENSSNSDSSEVDPTEVSHEFIEAIKIARTHMNALTRADGLLNNLQIQADFDIPKAHRIAVRLSGGPYQAQKEKLAENKIKMRDGRFTEEEDFLIMTNFSKFCEVHNLEDDPVPFLNLGKEHPLPYAEKVKFVQFIGQGLPRRYLRTIHMRFQLLMSRRKNGSFTQVEDEVILNCKGKLDMHQNELAGLEYVLCRSKKSILKRYEDLTQSKDVH